MYPFLYNIEFIIFYGTVCEHYHLILFGPEHRSNTTRVCKRPVVKSDEFVYRVLSQGGGQLVHISSGPEGGILLVDRDLTLLDYGRNCRARITESWANFLMAIR